MTNESAMPAAEPGVTATAAVSATLCPQWYCKHQSDRREAS